MLDASQALAATAASAAPGPIVTNLAIGGATIAINAGMAKLDLVKASTTEPARYCPRKMAR